MRRVRAEAAALQLSQPNNVCSRRQQTYRLIEDLVDDVLRQIEVAQLLCHRDLGSPALPACLPVSGSKGGKQRISRLIT